MKKSLIYLAMAAFVAMFAYACGSDSDDDGNDTKIREAQYVDQAAKFTITAGKVEAADDEVSLTALNFTEEGKAIIEVTKNNQKKYKTLDVAYAADAYVIKEGSKEVGRVIVNGTKATTNMSISIKLAVTVPGWGDLVFETDDPVEAVKAVQTVAKSTKTTDLAHTWAIQRMKLTLAFDDKNKADASVTENSGKLTKFIDLADKNGVKLSDNDRVQLSKEITCITIDQNALFTLAYSDGSTDAASWRWADSEQKNIRITLNGEDMGNKFLSNNSTIEVQFPKDGTIILIMSTYLKDDGCTASLLVNLK